MKYSFFSLLILFLLTLFATSSFGQCPEFEITNVSPPNDGSELCPGEKITISMEGVNLPQGTIDWYYTTDDDDEFNPYDDQGIYTGFSSNITPDESEIDICDPCPELLAIMIDACNGSGVESDNEFLILSSGGGISSAEQIQVNLDDQNNFSSSGATSVNDINLGNDPCEFLNSPNPSVISALQSSMDCDFSNIIGIGPNSPVPAGALVVVFLSSNTNVSYDFNNLCANGETIYVLQSNCPRPAGAFSNSTSSGCRNYQVLIGDCPGCDSNIAYNTSNASNFSTTGGYAYSYDANENGMIDYIGQCNSQEVFHVNGAPCEAPFVQSIPIPPIPSTIDDLCYFVPEDFCSADGPQTYYIRGILSSLFDGCIDNPFNPDFDDYEPFMTEIYSFEVNCQTPELTTPDDLCVGQTIDLNDYITDFDNYDEASGWYNTNDVEVNNMFTPTTDGTTELQFIPSNSDGVCYLEASITITVNEGDTPTLATATVCQSDTEFDLNTLEDPTNNDGTWQVQGGSGVVDDLFNANPFSAGDVVLEFIPNSTDVCALTATTTLSITEGPEIAMTTSNDLGCTNTSASLSTNATESGLTYLWEGLGIDASNESDENPAVTQAGIYNVTVTDANGCFNTGTIELMQNSSGLPDATTETPETILCNNLMVELQGNSTAMGATYSWEGPDGTLYPEQNPMVSDSGTYVLTVTNMAGCSSTTSLEVVADTMPPTIDILIPFDVLNCNNPETSLFGNSPMTNLFESFEWTLDGDFFSDEQNTSTTQAGDFVLTVTDLNGCISIDEVSVFIDTIPPTVSIEPVTEQLTCNDSDITLTGNATDAVFVSWEFPDGSTSTLASPNVDQAGTYTFTATSENGCTASATTEVMESADTPVITITPPVLDCNPTAGTIVTSTMDNITTYQWEGPSGYTSTASSPDDILLDGTYDLTITNDLGCTSTATTSITSDTNTPTAQIDSPNGTEIDCSMTPVNLQAINAETDATIEWLDPDNTMLATSSISATAEGTYTLVVTGSNGCSSTQTIEITADDTVPTTTVNQTVSLDCSQDGSLQVITNAQTVEWTLPDATTLNGTDIPATEGGMYTLIATGSNACTSTASIEVVADTISPLIAMVESEDISCTDANADLNASSSNTNVSITWETPSGGTLFGANQTVGAAGTYIVVVMDNENGCTSSSSAIVGTDDDTPDVAISATDGTTINCIETALELVGSSTSSGVEILWTNPDNTTSTDANITANSSGVYTFTVSNTTNGCSSTDMIEIFVDNAIPSNVQTGSGFIYCNPNSAEISVSSDDPTDSFVWSDPAGLNISSSPMATANTAGLYTVIATGSNGCTTSATAQVEEDNTPPTISTQGAIIDCTNNPFNLSGSSDADSFEWFAPNGDSYSTDSNPSVTATGVYTLVVTNTTTGCTNTATAEVMGSSDIPQASIAVANDIDCDNPTAILTATTDLMNVSYSWLDADDVEVGTNATFEANSAGNYSVLITNLDNDCSATAQEAVIGTSDIPQASIAVANDIDCDNPTAILTATTDLMNVSYSWLDANDVEVGTNATFEANSAGDYSVIITNLDNDCSGTAQETVIGTSDVPQASIAVANDIDCDNPTAILTATTDLMNVSYSWLDADDVEVGTNATFEANSAGDYSVIITNLDNDCSGTAQETVIGTSDVPQASIAVANDIDCDNPTAILTATTDLMNVSYSWLDADDVEVGTNATFEANSAGDYSVIITNLDNDCSGTAQETVIGTSDVPQASIAVANDIDCDNPTAILTATTDLMNVSYSWLDANDVEVGTNATFEANSAGDYSVIITNLDNDCTGTAQETVIGTSDVPDIDIQVGTENIIDCDTESVELEGSSTSNVTYSWEGPDGFTADTPTISAEMPGDYILTISSINSDCSNTQLYTVFDDLAPPAFQAAGGIITCDGNGINLSASSTQPMLSFEWTGPNGFTSSEANPSTSDAGTYNLVATSPTNGCIDSLEVEVFLDDGFPILQASAENIDCINMISTLDASLSTPPGDSIVYQWFLDDNPIGLNEISPTVIAGGMYELVGININNLCADTLEVEVQENITMPIANAGEDLEINCINNSVSLNANASEGDNLTYQWLSYTGELVSDEANIEIDTASPITLLVTDENGCTDTDDILITDNTLSPLAEVAFFGTINCTESSIELQGSTPFVLNGDVYSFEWFDENNVSIGNDSLQTVDSEGTYTLVITDNLNGCTDDIEVIVEEDIQAPAIVIANPDAFGCDTNEVIIDASDSDNALYYFVEWTGPTDANITGANTLEPSVDQAGIYNLAITNIQNGCSSEESIEVTSNGELPDAIASASNEFGCNVNEVQLSGTGSSEGATYEYAWTGPNITSSSDLLNINIGTAGTYNLVVTNTETGCSNQSSVDVPEGTEGINTSELAAEDEDCFGDNNGLISISNIQGGTAPYLYSIDGQSFGQNPQFANLSPGEYEVVIQDAEGCEWQESITVEAANPLVVELGDNIVIQLGETVDLDVQTSSTIDTIIWSNTDLEGLNPSLSPTNPTTISVTVVDENGCTETDAISIFIEKDRPIYIPTAFSPNEDGINDNFMIFGTSAVANVNIFNIYDRWGELVFSNGDFHPDDLDHGWDGIFRGKFLNPAVFVYYAEIEFTDGLIEVYKGDVTLMR